MFSGAGLEVKARVYDEPAKKPGVPCPIGSLLQRFGIGRFGIVHLMPQPPRTPPAKFDRPLGEAVKREDLSSERRRWEMDPCTTQRLGRAQPLRAVLDWAG